jgi:DNA-binding IscR family transcriptional regulator
MLHVLLHMAGTGKPVTSEQLAGYLDTNAVVVRRTMSGLREAGIVRSEKGHGGGWTIARDLSAITLADIYAGLGAPALFAIGNRNDNPNCLVEKAVNKALADTLREAEAMVVSRLGGVSLADIAADFRDRMLEFHDVMNKKGNSHV